MRVREITSVISFSYGGFHGGVSTDHVYLCDDRTMWSHNEGERKPWRYIGRIGRPPQILGQDLEEGKRYRAGQTRKEDDNGN